MRLKRLELFGFKSFADRTTIDFSGSLTGIVGPNGCGKSNVVDAIRWVLGETRPTSMRGGEMTDVIFKGSTSRAGLSIAEVTLVLDNTDETVEERGPEIAVTRRVFKSGEGEYALDGDRVRLKDIREMLFDTGLGSRGYSVLEQGRIDAVLSANPVDRRVIFEEAAGISRYRQRRKEAASRLKRVGVDMDRLEDVVGELERRVRSLKIQAGKAERFSQARDAWLEQGKQLARHQLHFLERDLGVLHTDLAQFDANTAELRALREASDADVQQREHELEALVAEADRLGAQASQLAEELSSVDERRAQLAARVHSWRESGEEQERRAGELGERVDQQRESLGSVDAEKAALMAAAREADAQVAEHGRRTREAREAHRAGRQRSEEQNERVLGLLHEKTAATNGVQHLERALAPLAERSERAVRRLADAEQSLADARDEVRLGETQISSHQEQLSRAEVLATELEGQRTALDQRIEGLADERNALELERTRLESRVESLLDWDVEREGLDAGARTVLESQAGGSGDEDSSSTDGPQLAAKLQGLLADHLRTSTRFARSLDAVLGERAQSLVVGDVGDAERLVAWLKAEERGQVRLVIPVPEGQSAGAAWPELDPERASWIEGRLRDHVEPTSGFEPLADRLLHDVFVVTQLEHAFALVRSFPHLRFATPEGDLVDAGGAVGGHREVSQGPIGRRSRAAELEGRAGELEGELAERERELATLRVEREEILDRWQVASSELSALKQELAKARATLQGSRARCTDLEDNLAVYEREAQVVAEERTRLDADLAFEVARLATAQSDFETENGLFSQLESERAVLEEHLDRLSREEAQRRIALTRVSEQVEACQLRHADFLRALEDLEHERKRAQQAARDHRDSAATGAAELETLTEQRTEVLEQRGAVETQLSELKTSEREGRSMIEELRRRVHAVTTELESVVAKAGDLRLDEQRFVLTREELVRRAEEELDLDDEALRLGFEPAEELQEESAREALATQVAGLKRTLDGIGPVNLDALGELEEAGGRLEFLTTQRDDLEASRKALENTIRTIDTESERMFREAFDEIRGNFQRIFRQLFGGGRADVTLDSEVDLLDAGIDILARPPGREMLPIGLLSGGQRTMTALALLFAVFQARPSPFCVLDEVDAALDDANIGRFLAMLTGFRSSSQFVLVTHNKGSMSACETLYGITMETQGVSRQVSVELDEIDAFVPEATGNAEEAQAAADEVARTDVSDAPDGNEADGSEVDESEVSESEVDADTGERLVELQPQPTLEPVAEPEPLPEPT